MEESEFGSILRVARKNKGFTQPLLAEILGVSVRTIQQYESGNTEPSLTDSNKLANALGITLDMLSGKEKLKLKDIPIFKNIVSIDGMKRLEFVSSSEPASPTWPKDAEYIGLEMPDASMEPRIYKGDILLIHWQETYEPGDFVLVLPENRVAIVRKIIESGDNYVLTPLNSIFNTEVLSKSACKILGVVKEQRSKY